METFSELLALCVRNSPVNSPHKGQCRDTLIFSLICIWINTWVNNREAGNLRRHRAHYDVIVMIWQELTECWDEHSSQLNIKFRAVVQPHWKFVKSFCFHLCSWLVELVEPYNFGCDLAFDMVKYFAFNLPIVYMGTECSYTGLFANIYSL